MKKIESLYSLSLSLFVKNLSKNLESKSTFRISNILYSLYLSLSLFVNMIFSLSLYDTVEQYLM